MPRRKKAHGRHLECFNELLKGSPTRLGGPVAWRQEVVDKCFEKGAYCDKVKKRDVVPAASSIETRGLSHHQPKHFVGYGCEGWTKPYYDKNAARCDSEMRKGTLDPNIMLTYTDDDRWDKRLMGKCFKDAICRWPVKRDAIPDSIGARTLEERKKKKKKRSASAQHVVLPGCEAYANNEFFLGGTLLHYNSVKCTDELAKGSLDPQFNPGGPRPWDQKLIDKCFKSAYCDRMEKRDAVLESNEGVVVERDVKPNKEYIMTISGMGKCSLHYRRFYFDNMVKGGKNDKKCNKELKKGLAKWKQGLIDKCFYISDCWNQKRDVEPVFQMESSPTKNIETLGDECRAVRIQLYACTDPDPSQCFANVWCCGDACEGPDVVGPATAAPDAPPSVKRSALAASGLQGLPATTKCLLDGTCKPGDIMGLPKNIKCLLEGRHDC
ncbi:MAG: hypothetical protein Q9210_004990 [Variospora velana]